MRRNEFGSVSLIFMALVVPILLLVAGLAIDISQFLRLRESLRDIIDVEAKVGLQRRRSSEEIAHRLRERLHPLVGRFHVAPVQVSSLGGSNRISLDGVYDGLVTSLFRNTESSSLMGIPFHLEVIARRPRTAALIVFDRSAEPGEPLCGSEALDIRARMVGRLLEELLSMGVSDVRVGVVPGDSGIVDILAAHGRIVNLPRCLNASTDGEPLFGGIAGAGPERRHDGIEVAYRLVSLLLTLGDAQKEQIALIMIGGSEDMSVSYVSNTLELLNSVARQQARRVIGVGIVRSRTVDDSSLQMPIGGDGGRMTYLRLSDDRMRQHVGVAAISEHIQGRIVVAQ